MERTPVKPRLTVECSSELVHKIKILGLVNDYPSLREFVLKTIAKQYPELQDAVDNELSRD